MDVEIPDETVLSNPGQASSSVKENKVSYAYALKHRTLSPEEAMGPFMGNPVTYIDGKEKPWSDKFLEEVVWKNLFERGTDKPVFRKELAGIRSRQELVSDLKQQLEEREQKRENAFTQPDLREENEKKIWEQKAMINELEQGLGWNGISWPFHAKYNADPDGHGFYAIYHSQDHGRPRHAPDRAPSVLDKIANIAYHDSRTGELIIPRGESPRGTEGREAYIAYLDRGTGELQIPRSQVSEWQKGKKVPLVRPDDVPDRASTGELMIHHDAPDRATEGREASEESSPQHTRATVKMGTRKTVNYNEKQVKMHGFEPQERTFYYLRTNEEVPLKLQEETDEMGTEESNLF